jgi:predicted RNA binding protein YcfA (HicA-like mRNA interferase family)
MPEHRLSPVSWDELCKNLKKLGFEGPFQGGKHPYMVKEDLILTLPNPHRKEIGIDLLKKILKQAGISRDEWEVLS